MIFVMVFVIIGILGIPYMWLIFGDDHHTTAYGASIPADAAPGPEPAATEPAASVEAEATDARTGEQVSTDEGPTGSSEEAATEAVAAAAVTASPAVPAKEEPPPRVLPTDEEIAHHYLWRFWRNVPRKGHVAIFDRSWYGRVLVERVEGFASGEEWKRAYSEINDFEEQLANRGMLVLKFWIHISQEEQLRRFKARENIPFKKYKITPDDYRNREKWNDYELAANEMFERTSTDYAPWCLVPGNDKRVARITVLKAVCRALKKILVRS